MTYAAERSFRLFKNEAERAYYQQFDWEAAGKAGRGATARFSARLAAKRAAANGN